MGESVLKGPIWGAVLVAAVALGLLSGCGGDSGESSAASTSSTDAALEKIASSDFTIAGKTEPDVTVPEGPPPKKPVIKTIESGEGPTAKVGDIVVVEYNGLKWNGRPYADSWTYPEPPAFELGGKTEPRLEYGLDLGVRGMKPGGRREVIVPANYLYWPGDEHGILPPDENAVVFIVDLIKIQ